MFRAAAPSASETPPEQLLAGRPRRLSALTAALIFQFTAITNTHIGR
jgi:hypothetical protein